LAKGKKKPGSQKPKRADRLNETKKGGIIWRAQFLQDLKEAQQEKPLTQTGQQLHSLSSDADYEAYFMPMMNAHSKWAIEYNLA
jgi:hypothetical protein